MTNALGSLQLLVKGLVASRWAVGAACVGFPIAFLQWDANGLGTDCYYIGIRRLKQQP